MASEKKREDDPTTAPSSAINNPTVALLCYCASSILMTVTNKYVLSGMHFNLNFLLLCVQSAVALLAIQTCKTLGIFHYRDFKLDEAKRCMCAVAFESHAYILIVVLQGSLSRCSSSH